MYPTIDATVGNTPLVRLKRIPGPSNDSRGNVILGKLEGNNPAGSVKDRPAYSMIRRAEERGEILLYKGLYFVKAHQEEEATKAFDACIQASPKSREATEAQKQLASLAE